MTVADPLTVAHRVDPDALETLDVLGPTVQILTPSTGDDSAPCLLRGTIPPGGVVPLHSHPEPETFIAISGRGEGLTDGPDGHRWLTLDAGDVFHVPGNARHAWRNPFDDPLVNMIVTTERIARFFREVGAPAGSGSSAPADLDAIERFLATAERYGHWIATPEENAAIGLPTPSAAEPG